MVGLDRVVDVDELVQDRIAMIGLVLVGILLRLPTSGSRPEHIDEAITLNFLLRMDYGELLFQLPFVQPHFPTYYLVLEAWLDVLGFTATNARLFSVLCGALTAPVLYAIGRELDTRTAGGIAGLLTAISPFYLELSQRIRMYSFWGFLAALSWLCFLTARRAGWTPRTTTAYATTAFLVSVTHYFGGFIVAAQATVLLLEDARTRQLSARAWTTLTIAVTPALAWLTYRFGILPSNGKTSTAEAMARVIGTPPSTLHNLTEYAVQFLIGRYPATHLPPTLVALLALEIVLAATIAIYLTHGRTRRTLAAWMLIPLLIPVALSLTVKPVTKPRYIVPVALGLYLALGVLTTRIRRPSIRGIFVALLISSAVLGLPAHYDHTGDRGWIQTRTHLDDHATPDDRLIAIGFFHAEVGWQTHTIEPATIAIPPTTEGVNIDSPCNCTIWVVLDTKSVFGTKESITAADLGLEDYHVVDVQDYNRLKLYRLAPSTSASA